MSQPPRRLTVTVPATSANLGPGYDTLALALALHLRAQVEPLDEGPSELAVEGEGAGELAMDDSNRLLAGLTRGYADAGVEAPAGWRIRMHNDIPLRRGLGSSAAASVAGLALAQVLTMEDNDPAALVAAAATLEGHPDNAAAAVHGGFVGVAGGRVVGYGPAPGLRAVVFIPARELATDEMRRAVPPTVPHADAVHNMGRTALIVTAFATGDWSLLRAMYDDRLHQPYRAQVYPEFPPLIDAAREAGAYGAALSGSGSTILALCRPDMAEAIATALEETATRLGLEGRSRLLEIAGSGFQVIAEP